MAARAQQDDVSCFQIIDVVVLGNLPAAFQNIHQVMLLQHPVHMVFRGWIVIRAAEQDPAAAGE